MILWVYLWFDQFPATQAQVVKPMSKEYQGISAQFDDFIDVFETMWGLNFLHHSCYLNTCLRHGCLCELHRATSSVVASCSILVDLPALTADPKRLLVVLWILSGSVSYFSFAIPSLNTLLISLARCSSMSVDVFSLTLQNPSSTFLEKKCFHSLVFIFITDLVSAVSRQIKQKPPRGREYNNLLFKMHCDSIITRSC